MAEKSALDQEAELEMLVSEVQRGDEELQHSRDENQLLLEQNRLLREKLERLEMEQSTLAYPSQVRSRERTPVGSIYEDEVSTDGHARGERPISPVFEHQRGPPVFVREWEKASSSLRAPTQSGILHHAGKTQQREGHFTPIRSNSSRTLEDISRAVTTTLHERKPCDPHSVTMTQSKPNIIPDRFDGKTPWNEYISHFEACRMANAWDETRAKVFLVASLRGPALKTLGGKISNASDLSYRQLVGLLEKRFGPGQLAENYLLELRYRRQGPRETIQELGQGIRELSMLAYPELTEEAQDRLARTHFTEAIEDQSVREGVFRSKPTSLDEAIQAALATDNFYRLEEQRTGRRNKQSRVLEGKSSTDPSSTEVDELRQELKWIREKLQCQDQASGEWSGRPRWSIPKSELRCYKCHEKGHFQRDCPRKSGKKTSQHLNISENEEQPTQGPEGRLDQN